MKREIEGVLSDETRWHSYQHKSWRGSPGNCVIELPTEIGLRPFSMDSFIALFPKLSSQHLSRSRYILMKLISPFIELHAMSSCLLRWYVI
jgi:hypothetical protein